MATKTFEIIGPNGKTVREETLDEQFAPALQEGETAQVKEDKKKSSATKPDTPPPADKAT